MWRYCLRLLTDETKNENNVTDVLLDALGVRWMAPSALWDGCPEGADLHQARVLVPTICFDEQDLEMTIVECLERFEI